MNLNKRKAVGVSCTVLSIFSLFSSFAYQAITIATNDPEDYRSVLIFSGVWLVVGVLATLAIFYVGGRFRWISGMLLVGAFALGYSWFRRYLYVFT